MTKLIEIDLIENLIIPAGSGAIGGILSWFFTDFVIGYYPIVKLGNITIDRENNIKTSISSAEPITITSFKLYNWLNKKSVKDSYNDSDNAIDGDNVEELINALDTWEIVGDQNYITHNVSTLFPDTGNVLHRYTFAAEIIYKPLSGIRRFFTPRKIIYQYSPEVRPNELYPFIPSKKSQQDILAIIFDINKKSNT